MRVVHDTRTRKHRKTRRNQNIFNKYCILTYAFIALNATKYLFCCVHFIIRADTVKMCLPIVDSLRFLDLAPSGTVQPVRRFRLLLDSTGGGGYSQAVPAGVSPVNTRKIKKFPSHFKNRAKYKKAFQKIRKQEKGPSPLKNPAKIKKAIFNFIKAPFGRYLTNFILAILLTIKYI